MLLSLAAFLVIVVCAVGFAYFLLQPIVRTENVVRRSSQYFVVDFFPLTFLLAIVFVYVGYSRRSWGRDTTLPDIAGTVLALVVVYAWWRGAVALSRIGVTHSGRRFVFLAFVLPVALLASALGVPFAIVGFFGMFVSPPDGGVIVLIWLGVIFGLTMALAICRGVLEWVLSEVDPPSDTEKQKAGSAQEKANPL